MTRYIATTGFFDGVHKGHVAVLERLKKVGGDLNLPVCVVTFWPHPRIVLNDDSDKLKLLSSVKEKKQYIESLGIHRVIVIPFTEKFSNISPKQFIVEELVEKYDIAGLCIGYDHHIGKNREGGFELIKEICNETGLYCERIPPLMIGDKIISSQKIRKYLLEGNVEEANFMLNYSYSLTGVVIHGQKLGGTIGFPTANIKVENDLKLIPAEGVYAVKVKIENCPKHLSGMLYIGKKAAANDPNKIFIEVNIFDFNDDLYGKQISVSFEYFVRKNMQFGNIREMKTQLTTDRQIVHELLSLNP
ncbi:MAG: riboflavin biosynthesis protein RibF [Prevotellaceae bacterium]|jgi:riboflavin kinase/FMN adenylyltransferase|nr:riboflavin biosynthesis protein RibF [Prevotellaceae bacterium]